MSPPPDACISAWSLPTTKRKAAKVRELQPAPETQSLWVDIEVTPIANVYPQLEACITRVRELAQLPRNWDSYGSAPVQERAISGALNVLKNLDFGTLPAPSISPVSGGGLQLEWSSPEGRSLELEFDPDGTLAFLFERDDDHIEGELPQSRIVEDGTELVRLFVNRAA